MSQHTLDYRPSPIWEDQDKKAYKRLTRARKLLSLSPWMTIICALCALLVTINYTNLSQGKSADDPVVAVASQLGYRTIETWMYSGGLPPGSVIIAPTGVTTSTTIKPSNTGVDELTNVTVTYAVVSGEALVYVATTVNHDSGTGVYSAVGRPSIVMDTQSFSSQPSTDAPWLGVTTSMCSESVRVAVEAWVGAYFSDSPAKLQTVVGDRNTDRHYLPVPGVYYKTPAVVVCANVDQKGDDASTIVAYVMIPIGWTPESVSEENSSLDSRGPMVAGFDVLVEGADSSAPNVTAWGPVGTGMGLKRYSNATPIDTKINPLAIPPTASPTETGDEGEDEETDEPTDEPT